MDDQTVTQKPKQPKHGTVLKNNEKSKKALTKPNKGDFISKENNHHGGESSPPGEKSFITTTIRSSITSKSLKSSKNDSEFDFNSNLYDTFLSFLKDLLNKMVTSTNKLKLIVYEKIEVI